MVVVLRDGVLPDVIRRRNHSEHCWAKIESVSLRLAGCLGLSIFAIFWWLFMAGTEHRYLFPFILMIIIWLLPDVLERLREASTTVKSAVACYSLVPAFLLPLSCYGRRSRQLACKAQWALT